MTRLRDLLEQISQGEVSPDRSQQVVASGRRAWGAGFALRATLADQLDQLLGERMGRERLVITAKGGETLAQVARRYGLEDHDLARINRVPRTSVLSKGQELVVYKVVDTSRSHRAAEQKRELDKGKPKKKGHKIFPIVWGRAQLLLGRVKPGSAKKAKAAKREPGRPAGRGPGRPPKRGPSRPPRARAAANGTSVVIDDPDTWRDLVEAVNGGARLSLSYDGKSWTLRVA